MVVIGSIGTNKPQLASSQYDRPKLKAKLITLGIYWRFGSLSPGRLLRLPLEQFNLYLELFGKLWPKSTVQTFTIKLYLKSPSINVLMAAELRRLMDTPAAMADMKQNCYDPENGRIDLTPLEWINRKYRETD